MKFCSTLLCVFAATLVIAGEIQYVDSQVWISNLEQIRAGHEGKENLARYDRKLLAEYFEHSPVILEKDALWKLYGLAYFGNPSASNIIATLINRFEHDHPEVKADWSFFGLGVRVRQGDLQALHQLETQMVEGKDMFSRIYGAELLRFYGSKEAIDVLAGCAANRSVDPLQRLKCAHMLGFAGDERFWKIVLSPEFEMDIKNQPIALVSIALTVAQVTGDEKINELPSREKVIEYVKQNEVRLSRKTENISVRGGIDWLKVDWTKLRQP